MPAELHSLTTRRNFGKSKDLLHSLVPKAQCFCFYDMARSCTWSSDGADDYEVNEFVTELPGAILFGEEAEAEYLRRTLQSGRTLLLLPVCTGDNQPLGLLVVVFSKNAGKSSWFNPSLLFSILAPAVALIGERLHTSQLLDETVARANEVESELKIVYEVDEKIHGQSRSHAGLAQLVGQSGRYLEIGYSVLLMPAKRIRISATHSSWKNARRKTVDRYLIESLYPKLEGKRYPVVYEVPPVAGGDSAADSGYQAMLCPLTDQYGNLEGMIAQLGRVIGEPFTTKDRRFMSHIVRKVEYVIEQSFDSMTGLMNRSGFEAQLHEAWKTASSPRRIRTRSSTSTSTTCSSSTTHSAARRVTRSSCVSRDCSRKTCQEAPYCPRLTGDDFCILLTHADTVRAVEFANDIRERGQALRYLEGEKALQVTISTGVAEFNRRSGDEGAALTAARMACESAKDHGRDRIEIYDEKDHSIIRRHDDMQLVAQIQQTIDSDGIRAARTADLRVCQTMTTNRATRSFCE